MADKIKTGFLLLGGCAGCEMSVVDLSEKLVDALAHIEVAFWAPTVADVKYDDLENMEDGAIDVAFIDGMIRLDEHIHMAKIMRKKAKVLIAFGVCAALGGTAGMGSLHDKNDLFEKAFKNTPTTDNPDGVYPQPECLVDGKYNLTLPAYEDKVRTLNQIVEVDYYIGGCPPHPNHVAAAINALVTGELPPREPGSPAAKRYATPVTGIRPRRVTKTVFFSTAFCAPLMEFPTKTPACSSRDTSASVRSLRATAVDPVLTSTSPVVDAAVPSPERRIMVHRPSPPSAPSSRMRMSPASSWRNIPTCPSSSTDTPCHREFCRRKCRPLTYEGVIP